VCDVRRDEVDPSVRPSVLLPVNSWMGDANVALSGSVRMLKFAARAKTPGSCGLPI
jgi:hypothetical protein